MTAHILTIRRAIGATLLALGAAAAAAESSEPATEPFSETFDRLDKRLWYISDGWRNGDHQNCTWSSRAVTLAEGGGLVLSYRPDPVDPLCGEVQTRARFLHGTFEARMRADGGSGRNAAFFSYIGPVHDRPHDEIDFELLTRQDGLVWTNRFVDGDDFDAGTAFRASGDPAEFIDLAFVWEPERLRWYVNGTLVREETDGIPTHAMKIYFSHWGSDSFHSWMGPFEMPERPVDSTITRFGYTPLGESCAFDWSITCGELE